MPLFFEGKKALRFKSELVVDPNIIVRFLELFCHFSVRVVRKALSLIEK